MVRLPVASLFLIVSLVATVGFFILGSLPRDGLLPGRVGARRGSRPCGSEALPGRATRGRGWSWARRQRPAEPVVRRCALTRRRLLPVRAPAASDRHDPVHSSASAAFPADCRPRRHADRHRRRTRPLAGRHQRDCSRRDSSVGAAHGGGRISHRRCAGAGDGGLPPADRPQRQAVALPAGRVAGRTARGGRLDHGCRLDLASVGGGRTMAVELHPVWSRRARFHDARHCWAHWSTAAWSDLCRTATKRVSRCSRRSANTQQRS